MMDRDEEDRNMARWLETARMMAAFGLVAVVAAVPATALGQTRERDVEITGPKGRTIDRQFKSTVTPNGINRQTTITRPGGTFTRDVNISRPAPAVRGWVPQGRPPVFIGGPRFIGGGGISGGEAFGLGALGAAVGTGAGLLLGRAMAPPPAVVVAGPPVVVAAPGVIVAGPPAVMGGAGPGYAPVRVLPPPNPEVNQAIGRLASWHESTRKESCYVLGRIGDPRAVPALVDVLKNERSKDVRVAAATAVGQIGDPSSAIFLQRVTIYDKNQEVRDAATAALARMPREEPATTPAQAAPRYSSSAVSSPAPVQSEPPTRLEPAAESVPPPPTPVLPGVGR
jgi:hypothetical protein